MYQFPWSLSNSPTAFAKKNIAKVADVVVSKEAKAIRGT